MMMVPDREAKLEKKEEPAPDTSVQKDISMNAKTVPVRYWSRFDHAVAKASDARTNLEFD